MKKNIILLGLLCSVLSLRAMDNGSESSRSLEAIVGTFDESSDELLLQNKTGASNKNRGNLAVVMLNRNLTLTPKKSKKHSNATKIVKLEETLAELKKRLAALEKLVGIKN